MEENQNLQSSENQVNLESSNQILHEKKSNTLKITVGLVILILAFLVVGMGAYILGMRKTYINPLTVNPTPTNTAILPVVSNTETLPSSEPTNLVQYKDNNLENFSFNYDPDIWTIASKPTPDSMILMLKNNSNGDLLTFTYNLGWGVGGSLETFKEGELVQVSPNSTVYRLKTFNNGEVSYIYGKYNKTPKPSQVIFFKENPEEKIKAIDHCNDIADGFEGIPLYTDDECKEITSGEIIGYAQFPLFHWGIFFKNAAPLSQLNPTWAADEYVKSEGLDNGRIIMETVFEGSTPEEADKIVQQLFPINLD